MSELDGPGNDRGEKVSPEINLAEDASLSVPEAAPPHVEETKQLLEKLDKVENVGMLGSEIHKLLNTFHPQDPLGKDLSAAMEGYGRVARQDMFEFDRGGSKKAMNREALAAFLQVKEELATNFLAPLQELAFGLHGELGDLVPEMNTGIVGTLRSLFQALELPNSKTLEDSEPPMMSGEELRSFVQRFLREGFFAVDQFVDKAQAGVKQGLQKIATECQSPMEEFSERALDYLASQCDSPSEIFAATARTIRKGRYELMAKAGMVEQGVRELVRNEPKEFYGERVPTVEFDESQLVKILATETLRFSSSSFDLESEQSECYQTSPSEEAQIPFVRRERDKALNYLIQTAKEIKCPEMRLAREMKKVLNLVSHFDGEGVERLLREIQESTDFHFQRAALNAVGETLSASRCQALFKIRDFSDRYSIGKGSWENSSAFAKEVRDRMERIQSVALDCVEQSMKEIAEQEVLGFHTSFSEALYLAVQCDRYLSSPNARLIELLEEYITNYPKEDLLSMLEFGGKLRGRTAEENPYLRLREMQRETARFAAS